MLFLDNHGQIGYDVYEIVKTVVPSKLENLNDKNLPDVFYLSGDNRSIGFELKQPPEILGNLPDVTEQLSREYTQVDELSLYIDGIPVPNPHGFGCYTLKWADNERSAYLVGKKGGGAYQQDYEGYRKWCRSLRHWGIEVYEAPTIRALAAALVGAYRWDQKPESEHKTFRQPIRTKKPMGSWDPRGLSLMGLVDPKTGRTFLGPEIAQALLQVYSNVIGVLWAPEAEVAKVPLVREEGDTRRPGTVGPARAAALKRATGTLW